VLVFAWKESRFFFASGSLLRRGFPLARSPVPGRITAKSDSFLVCLVFEQRQVTILGVHFFRPPAHLSLKARDRPRPFRRDTRAFALENSSFVRAAFDACEQSYLGERMSGFQTGIDG
jgi:hypothetical protein